MKIEPVAYSREHDANSPSYYDVVSPNSQDAEMWAYALVPLYDQQAIDTLRAEVEHWKEVAAANKQAEEHWLRRVSELLAER